MEIFSRISKRAAGGTGAVFTLTALLAATALAVTPAQTREAYVEQVEPICKSNTKANERILKGAEGRVKQGKLKLAAGQFTKAAAAFRKALTELRAVQQPAEDSAKLNKWLKKLDDEAKLLGEIGKALKDENKIKAQGLSVRLTHNGNLANNIVLGFGFDYCLIDSSKFT